MERLTAKCARYATQSKEPPPWVRAGMDARFSCVEQVEHRVQMLLGIFSAKSVLPLGFKPAYSVGDLLPQHLDELEQEAERDGRGAVSSRAELAASTFRSKGDVIGALYSPS